MKKILIIISFSFAINIANGQVYSNDQNIANNGYDVVNYFVANEAARGFKKFSSEFKGATYYFANESNRQAFNQNPERYLPQFDGYCAFAVAKMKQKVPVDPETFRVDDGKLYLFFNDYYEGSPFNTLIPWLQSESELEEMANKNWKEIQ